MSSSLKGAGPQGRAPTKTFTHTPPPEAEDLLRAGGSLPIVMVTIEGGHIVDVRVATRDFITAHLAAGSLTSNRGDLCNESAGRFPSSSD